MKVDRLPLSRMRQQQAYSFFRNVAYYARPLSVSEVLEPYIDEFVKQVDVFDEALSPVRRSLLTEPLRDLNRTRHRSYSSLRSTVRYMMHFDDEEVVELARKARAILDAYKNPTKQAYSEASGIYDNLLADLNDQFSQEERRKLSIESWVVQLSQFHVAFKQMFLERNRERMSFCKGRAQEARKAVDAAYLKFVKIVEVFSITQEDAILRRNCGELIAQINVLVQKELPLIKRRAKLENMEDAG